MISQFGVNSLTGKKATRNTTRTTVHDGPSRDSPAGERGVAGVAVALSGAGERATHGIVVVVVCRGSVSGAAAMHAHRGRVVVGGGAGRGIVARIAHGVAGHAALVAAPVGASGASVAVIPLRVRGGGGGEQGEGEDEFGQGFHDFVLVEWVIGSAVVLESVAVAAERARGLVEIVRGQGAGDPVIGMTRRDVAGFLRGVAAIAVVVVRGAVGGRAGVAAHVGAVGAGVAIHPIGAGRGGGGEQDEGEGDFGQCFHSRVFVRGPFRSAGGGRRRFWFVHWEQPSPMPSQSPGGFLQKCF